jgi:hypothetical protein
MSSAAPLEPPGPTGGVQAGSEVLSLEQGKNPRLSLDGLHHTNKSQANHQPCSSSGSAATPHGTSKLRIHGPMTTTSEPSASDSEVPGHAQVQQESRVSSRSALVASIPIPASPTASVASESVARIPGADLVVPFASPALAPIPAATPTAPTTNSVQQAQSQAAVSTPSAATLAPLASNPLASSTAPNVAQSQAHATLMPSGSRLAASGRPPHVQYATQHGPLSVGVERSSAIYAEIEECNAWRKLPAQEQSDFLVKRAMELRAKKLYAELFEIGRTRLPERRPDWALSTGELHDLYPAFGFLKRGGPDPNFLIPVDPENWLFPHYRVLPQDIQGLATWSELTMNDGGVGGIWCKLLNECPYKPNDDLVYWRQRLVECLQRHVTEIAAQSWGNLGLERQNALSSSRLSSVATGDEEANEGEELEGEEAYESGDWEYESEMQELEAGDEQGESQPSASLRVLTNNEINSVEHAGEVQESVDEPAGEEEGDVRVAEKENATEEQVAKKATCSEGHLEAQTDDDFQETVRAVAIALFRGDMNRAATYLGKGGLVEQTQRFGGLNNRPSTAPMKGLGTKRSRPSFYAEDFGAGPSAPPPKRAEHHDGSTSPAARESFHCSSYGTSSPPTMRDLIGASNKRKRSAELEDPEEQRSSKKGKRKAGTRAQSSEKESNYFDKSVNEAQAKLPAKLSRHTVASSVTPSGASQAQIPNSAHRARTGTTPNSLLNGDAQTRPPALASHHVPAVPAQNNNKEKFAGSSWYKNEGRALYHLVKAQRDSEQAENRTPLKDVKFWNLMSDRLRAQGINRSGSACKNFWGRIGRGYFDYEERIKPKNPNQKVTSAQLSKKEKQAKKAEEEKQKARQQKSARFENEMQGQTLEDGEEDGQYEESDHYEESEQYEEDGQYEESEQYEQDGQYEESEQYEEDGQYEESEQYEQDGQAEEYGNIQSV